MRFEHRYLNISNNMKKVIDGKLYNTETAEAIAHWSNDLPRGDFRNCDETLLKTAKGAFFVYGEGGAMTQWSQAAGDMRCGGTDILAMTTDEARAWCETHSIDADTIAQHFDIEEA